MEVTDIYWVLRVWTFQWWFLAQNVVGVSLICMKGMILHGFYLFQVKEWPKRPYEGRKLNQIITYSCQIISVWTFQWFLAQSVVGVSLICMKGMILHGFYLFQVKKGPIKTTKDKSLIRSSHNCQIISVWTFQWFPALSRLRYHWFAWKEWSCVDPGERMT